VKLRDTAGTLGGERKAVPTPAPESAVAEAFALAGKPGGQPGGGSSASAIVLDGPAKASSVVQAKYEWFTCTLPGDGWLYVATLQPLFADEDSDLYVYKPTSAGGSLVGSSTRGHGGDSLATPDFVAFESYAAGDWRLGVYGYSPAAKRDPNDFTIEADRVRLIPENGTVLTGDVAAANSRWYSFEAIPTLSYTIRLTCSSGDADLYVYGAASDQFRGQSVNVSGDDTVAIPWGTSGRHCVRVYGSKAASFGISVIPFDPLRATRYEYDGGWGSRGTGNGQFNGAWGLALDGAGNVYVGDANQSGNERIEKFTSAGQFLTTWGSLGSGPGQFRDVWGIAVGGSGYVYAADYFNHRIQKFTRDGQFVMQWGSEGTGDGQFRNPAGVAVDAAGNVYVTESQGCRVQKFTSTGQFILKWGTEGIYGNGEFRDPQSIAVDPFGNVYVSDDGNHRLQKFSSNGQYITQWGRWDSSGAQFGFHTCVTVDGQGHAYTSSDSYSVIQKWSGSGTLLATWSPAASGDGTFASPYGIGVSAQGYVYVVDYTNARVKVFRPVP